MIAPKKYLIVKLSFSCGKENIGTDFQASWLKSVVSIISNNHCVLKLEITKVKMLDGIRTRDLIVGIVMHNHLSHSFRLING